MLQQRVFQFCGVFHSLSFDKNGRSVHINRYMNADPGWFALCWLRSRSIEQWGGKEKKRREMEWALSCWKATNPLQLRKTFSSLTERARLKAQGDRLRSRLQNLENWISNPGPSFSPSSRFSNDSCCVGSGACSETILHFYTEKRWL